MVNHDATKPHLDIRKLSGMVKPGCVIVDTQYFFSPDDVESAGFRYMGIGRRGRK
jgi:hypothetical protein